MTEFSKKCLLPTYYSDIMNMSVLDGSSEKKEGNKKLKYNPAAGTLMNKSDLKQLRNTLTNFFF